MPYSNRGGSLFLARTDIAVCNAGIQKCIASPNVDKSDCQYYLEARQALTAVV